MLYILVSGKCGTNSSVFDTNEYCTNTVTTPLRFRFIKISMDPLFVVKLAKRLEELITDICGTYTFI